MQCRIDIDRRNFKTKFKLQKKYLYTDTITF